MTIVQLDTNSWAVFVLLSSHSGHHSYLIFEAASDGVWQPGFVKIDPALNAVKLDVVEQFSINSPLNLQGSVGPGVDQPTERLEVNGKIRAKEIKVETAGWPDYVFEDNYALPSL